MTARMEAANATSALRRGEPKRAIGELRPDSAVDFDSDSISNIGGRVYLRDHFRLRLWPYGASIALAIRIVFPLVGATPVSCNRPGSHATLGKRKSRLGWTKRLNFRYQFLIYLGSSCHWPFAMASPTV
jgi:hypothetical protein